eukprot:Skav227337  [mRNA]  locus=scaffold624:49328:52128:- [translate_table: standard]
MSSSEESSSSSDEEDLESCSTRCKERSQDWLKRRGFVLEKPSAICFMKNLRNLAFGLMALAIVGCIFGTLGLLKRDRMLTWESFLLCITAAGMAITVGSDPCFLKHLRESVILLGFQNQRLRDSSTKSHINMSLAKVRGQLDNDAQATHELLVALEHQGKVQAVSSSVGLFFVADRDARKLRMAAWGCHQLGEFAGKIGHSWAGTWNPRNQCSPGVAQVSIRWKRLGALRLAYSNTAHLTFGHSCAQQLWHQWLSFFSLDL